MFRCFSHAGHMKWYVHDKPLLWEILTPTFCNSLQRLVNLVLASIDFIIWRNLCLQLFNNAF